MEALLVEVSVDQVVEEESLWTAVQLEDRFILDARQDCGRRRLLPLQVELHLLKSARSKCA